MYTIYVILCKYIIHIHIITCMYILFCNSVSYIDLTTVSYTHLDVYKRQVKPHVGRLKRNLEYLNALYCMEVLQLQFPSYVQQH